jgi:hypothetical protein
LSLPLNVHDDLKQLGCTLLYGESIAVRPPFNLVQ